MVAGEGVHTCSVGVVCLSLDIGEWAEGWAEGEGQVYEAYEVKNKRQKLRCLLLRRKKKNIFYLFMK